MIDLESKTRLAYVRALLSADTAGASRVAEEALRGGMTPQRLYLGVFQRALYEIGALWQQGQATIAQEHLATATTQGLMARLWPEGEPPSRCAPRAIITATEGDWHLLGARFVADFLGAEGWAALTLRPSTPTSELVALTERLAPAVVCLSTTLPGNLPAARTAIAALRQLVPAPLVAVGGHAYANGGEALALRCGADLYASDAAAFVTALRAHRPEPSLL